MAKSNNDRNLEPLQEEYIFRIRDEQESQRLNAQHKSLLAIADSNFLHPTIDKGRIYNIANVGTGTGICIEELAGSLEAIPLQDPSKTRSYLGFDISPKQLPVISKHNIIYKIHDAKERFPPEHRGRFDVVHVRVLVLAVKEVEIARVVMNLIELLKPGGYIQWEEFNLSKYTCVPRSPKYLSHQSLYVDYATEAGFSFELPSHLRKTFHELGLKDILGSEWTMIGCMGKNGFTEDDDKKLWISLMKGVLPVVLAGKFRDTQDLQVMLADIMEAFRDGVLPEGKFELVLGKWSPSGEIGRNICLDPY